MIDDKSLYQFVLLSYATELTTVEWSRSCSFWSRSHNSVLILISVSLLVLVLHSLVSVLASVSLCSGLISSLKESTTKIGYLSDVLSVSDAVGLYCLEPDRLFFLEFILLIAFLPRCMQCRRGIVMRILSVRLSVRHTRALWQNGRKICPDLYTIRKNVYLTFLKRRMVGGGRPLLPEILGQLAPVRAKSPIFNQ